MERKRKGGDDGPPSKKNKKWNLSTKSSREQKELLDQRGILVTCNTEKEPRSMKEVLNICNEYRDRLFPQEEVKDSEEKKELSIEEELEKEISNIKKEKKEKKTGI